MFLQNEFKPEIMEVIDSFPSIVVPLKEGILFSYNSKIYMRYNLHINDCLLSVLDYFSK